MEKQNPIVEDRRAIREAPGPHFVRVAKMWSAVLGHHVDASQVVLCMVALKVAREAGRHDSDNMADAEGYSSIYNEVLEYIKEPDPLPTWVGGGGAGTSRRLQE